MTKRSVLPLLLTLTILIAGAKSLILQGGNSGNNTTCKLVTFLPFTDLREGPPASRQDPGTTYYGYGSWPNEESLAQASFSLLAVAELAREHFNARNPVLVPELAQLGDCSITLPSMDADDSNPSYLDSGYDRRTAVRQLQSHTDVCAVIGPVDDFAAAGVSVLTEAMHVPLLAFATIGYRLSRREEFPTFARVIPEAYDFGETVAKYFQRDVLVRGSAGIIYDDTDYGEQFESPIEDAEDYLGEFVTITESFSQDDDDALRSALEEAKEKGFRTIVLVIDRTAILDDVASIAEEMGMLGKGYVWILSGQALPPALQGAVKYEVNSPADKLLRGAALFTNYDRFVYNGETDPFLSVWRAQDESKVNQLNELVPRNPITREPYYVGAADYFQNEDPAIYSSFLYDAVIAAGVSACRAKSINDEVGFDENRHMEQVLATEFQGASGSFKFKSEENDNGEVEYENSRHPEDLIFGMYNVRPGIVDENNMQRYAHALNFVTLRHPSIPVLVTNHVSFDDSYNVVLTSIYSTENAFVGEDGSVEHGAWGPVDGTEFLFFDGTADEPMPRRETADANYLSKSIHVTGILLACVGMIIAIGSGIWVFLHRHDKAIKARQPEFLYLLCFGAVIMSPSSIFLAFDEDKGQTDDELDGLCSAVPWFFVLGYLIMCCAVFSKLWRLSKLLQLRRRVVMIHHVLFPFIAIVASSLTVLLVWQLVDPFVWERTVISDLEEPLETYGECTCSHLIGFMTPLACLVFGTVATTAYFSWKLRDVQEELSESKWIFAAIFLHIQAWLVGVPVAYITNGVSRDAYYLMIACLIFTLSTSLVILVVWPAVFIVSIQKYFPHKRNPMISMGGSTTRVSGLIGSSGHMSVTSLGGNSSDGQNADKSTTKTKETALQARVCELEQTVLNLKNKSATSIISEDVDDLGNSIRPIESVELEC